MSVPDLRMTQGLLAADDRGIRVLAQSDGFNAAEAERIVGLYGVRTAACSLAHFACPFGRDSVCVSTVADRPDGALGFLFLVLSRDLYQHLGDPFAIADRYTPDWNARGTLSGLEWPEEPLPRRRVEELQEILKTGDSPLLLGGTQALVDGSAVLVQRQAPDETLFRGLWQLLPDRTRCNLWPATFAFSNALGFDAAALPELPEDPRRLRHTEDGLRDYPQGRYELHLQIAIEGGDQREVDRLFTRRTSDDTIRLGLTILVLAMVLSVIAKVMF